MYADIFGTIPIAEALLAKGALLGVVPVSYTHLDVYKRQLQRYATGTTARIPANRLRQIASALGVTVDYLLNIKPPRAVDPNETEAEREERLGLPKGTFKRIAASKKAKKNINTSEDDLKFALFGCEDVSDEAFEDVKRYAEWIKEKHKLDKEKEQH